MLAALGGSPFCQALAWALLHFIWQGAVIAGALALALRLLARSSASARYAAACAALSLMALAPPVTLWLLWSPAPAPALTAGAALHLAAAPLTSPQPPPPGAELLGALLLGWMAGAVLMATRVAGGLARLRDLVRDAAPLPEPWQARLRAIGARLGMKRAALLLGSRGIDAPITLGWLRPVILVPLSALTALPAPCLEAILAHELAHVRRWDYLVNILQSAVEAALFYHPAVHWASARIRAEREHCCDDIAAGLVDDPIKYARALLALEELRADAPAMALASTGGSLMLRIRRLVNDQQHKPTPRRPLAGWILPALFAAGALGLTLVGVAACGEERADAPEARADSEDEREAAALGIPWLPPALKRWAPAFEAAASRHGVDPEALAIMTLVESLGDPEARSPGGAVGLMQLMPKTAEKIAEERRLEGHAEERLRDPAYNLDLGAYYFSQQLSAFRPLAAEGDPARAVELAAAAYNGGPVQVRAYLDGAAQLSEETARYKDLVAGMWRERRDARSPTYEAWRTRVRERAAARAASPLPGARVTQPFGAAGRPHAGVDLAEPLGTPIHAPLDGTVARAENDGDRGNVVVIEHGRGLETRYHHLGDVAVRPGQRIGRGEVIGTVGATGKVTGPHLHFEVRDNGEPIDPAPYVEAGAAGR